MKLKFKLNQKVRIKMSLEEGAIESRTEHNNTTPNIYLVNYLDHSGGICSRSFYEEEIDAIKNSAGRPKKPAMPKPPKPIAGKRNT